MWVLFHVSLTRAELESGFEGSDLRAVEVAVIIRDYVARFFSCAECKLHFGKMSSRLEQLLETDKDAVLWFWIAHNKVHELSARRGQPRGAAPPPLATRFASWRFKLFLLIFLFTIITIEILGFNLTLI